LPDLALLTEFGCFRPLTLEICEIVLKHHVPVNRGVNLESAETGQQSAVFLAETFLEI
jgi:hypothetical protein